MSWLLIRKSSSPCELWICKGLKMKSGMQKCYITVGWCYKDLFKGWESVPKNYSGSSCFPSCGREGAFLDVANSWGRPRWWILISLFSCFLSPLHISHISGRSAQWGEQFVCRSLPRDVWEMVPGLNLILQGNALSLPQLGGNDQNFFWSFLWTFQQISSQIVSIINVNTIFFYPSCEIVKESEIGPYISRLVFKSRS